MTTIAVRYSVVQSFLTIERIYIFTGVYMCTHLFIHIHMYMHIYSYMYAYIYSCVDIHICIHICMCCIFPWLQKARVCSYTYTRPCVNYSLYHFPTRTIAPCHLCICIYVHINICMFYTIVKWQLSPRVIGIYVYMYYWYWYVSMYV